MNVLIVTIGLSGLSNEDIGKAGMSSNTTLRGQVEHYLKNNRQEIKYWGELLDSLVEAHKRFWQQGPGDVASKSNRRQTSAELVSTHLLVKDLPFIPDQTFLLSSDTDSCWMATTINYRVMTELWGMRNVRAERVEGLDENMQNVTDRLLTCFSKYMRLDVVPTGAPSPNKDNVVCNITGGYKGTLPELALIAQANSWRLFYLHEKNGSTVEISLDPSKKPESRTIRDADTIPRL